MYPGNLACKAESDKLLAAVVSVFGANKAPQALRINKKEQTVVHLKNVVMVGKDFWKVRENLTDETGSNIVEKLWRSAFHCTYRPFTFDLCVLRA